MGLFLKVRAAAGVVGSFCFVTALFDTPMLWQTRDPDHGLSKDIVGLGVFGIGGFFLGRWGFGCRLQLTPFKRI